MQFDRHTLRSLLLLICGCSAFYAALQHPSTVASILVRTLEIFAPLLLGAAIAFVLNVPMRTIERHLPFRTGKAAALRRPLALVLTLAAVLGVLALAGTVVLPGIRDAVSSLAAQVPVAFARLQESAAGLQDYLPALAERLESLTIDWPSLSHRLLELAQKWGMGLLVSGSGFLRGMISGVTTFFVGVVFSIYILLQKETLARQCRRLLYALLPEPAADTALDILRLSEKTFSSFLSGQCLEAVILGTLFTVSMWIFRFPYALLTGVLIALTALVPIVGAFIGCAVGAVLMLVNHPWQAVWFIVLFLCLQQIEGNLIYPHVVGSSVGLPSIWVLAAVSVGGSLFGIPGMLFFIPLCSVLYALLRRFTGKRLAQKEIPAAKWADPPQK